MTHQSRGASVGTPRDAGFLVDEELSLLWDAGFSSEEEDERDELLLDERLRREERLREDSALGFASSLNEKLSASV